VLYRKGFIGVRTFRFDEPLADVPLQVFSCRKPPSTVFVLALDQLISMHLPDVIVPVHLIHKLLGAEQTFTGISIQVLVLEVCVQLSLVQKLLLATFVRTVEHFVWMDGLDVQGQHVECFTAVRAQSFILGPPRHHLRRRQVSVNHVVLNQLLAGEHFATEIAVE